MNLIKNRALIKTKDIEKILDLTHEAFIVIDPKKFDMIYFNKASYESLGYKKDDFEKEKALFFIDQSDINFIETIKKRVLSGETVSFISQHTNKNGSIQYADLKLFNINYGRKKLICGIWNDITAEVDFSIDQKYKKKRLNQFLEVFNEISHNKDFVTGNISTLSKVIAKTISETLDIDRVSIRLFSEDKNELISIALYDKVVHNYLPGKLLKRDTFPEIFDFMDSQVIVNVPNINKNRIFKDMIVDYFSQDGMINALLGTKIILDGDVKGYILFQSMQETEWDRDSILFATQIADQISITLLNSLLKEQQQILEEKVKERTKELLKSKIEAETANKAKTKFLSNISHELRTPLNAIIGFLSLIDDKIDREKANYYVEKIKDASNDLLSIINDVLDFSKIESGKMEYNPKWVDLEKLFNQIVSFYQNFFSSGNVIFNADITIKNKIFYLDQKLLKQIIYNLLSNAIKFTESGYIQFEIKETYLNNKKSTINIIVKDTGIGIKKDYLETIFNPFEQADNIHKKEIKGTGLGLAITKELVGLFNGSISVESEVDSGTKFEIEFPLEFNIENQEIYLEEKTVKQDESSLTGKSILIVDDNKINLDLVKMLFNSYKVSIDLAQNGYEALKLFDEKKHDLILMDIHMPLLDGLITTKIIRLRKPIKEPIIIALTANAFEFEENNYIDRGFDDYLIKPITKDQLISKITDKVNQTNQFDILINNNSLENIILQAIELDIKTGIKYTGNNKELYFKLLSDFLTKHKDDLELCLNDLELHDKENAFRYIHTLKSLLKMFSFDYLYKKITFIESLFKENAATEKIKTELITIKQFYDFTFYLASYIFIKKEVL